MSVYVSFLLFWSMILSFSLGVGVSISLLLFWSMILSFSLDVGVLVSFLLFWSMILFWSMTLSFSLGVGVFVSFLLFWSMILSFSLGVCICFLKSVEVSGIAEKGMCFGLKPSRSGFYFLIFPVWLVRKWGRRVPFLVWNPVDLAFIFWFLILSVWFCILASKFWIGIWNSLYYLHFSFINQRQLEIWSHGSLAIAVQEKEGRMKKI